MATTTSAPPRRRIICGLIETPPYSTATLVRVGRANANWLNTSPTWDASSRVGTKTSTLGSLCWGVFFKACSKGRAKATVFPDPVWAQAKTSRPSSTEGMDAACTGVGAVKPLATAAWASAGDKPREAKGMDWSLARQIKRETRCVREHLRP